jgi:sugar transferase (PEP-CTERM system associated)
VAFRLFRLHVRLPMALLVFVEGALFVFAPVLAAAILATPPQDLPAVGLMSTAWFFATVCLFSMFAVGMYTYRQRAGLSGLVVRVAVAMLATIAICAFVFFLLPPVTLDRRTLLLSGVVAFMSSVVVRMLFERIVDEDLFKSRVIVYGGGRLAASILSLRRRTDQRGFRLLGFITTVGDAPQVPNDKQLERPEDLFAWAIENDVDEIVVAMDDRRQGFPVHEFLECRMAGIEVMELPSFLERETGKVHLDILNPSWIIFGDGFGASYFQRALERIFDIVASTALLILASPFMLLAALAIRIEDGLGAPILYQQIRVGQHGKRFGVYKFRSMRTDAESAGAQWAVKDDPRVTRVGSIIRKTRIDELPQLWNVLRGDMSFVGPRPERPEFVGELEQRIPYYRERHTVKPGITGWAQLCYPYGSSEKDALEKLQYDLYYVKNRSLIFDLAILVQTVEVVLWGKGAR